MRLDARAVVTRPRLLAFGIILVFLLCANGQQKEQPRKEAQKDAPTTGELAVAGTKFGVSFFKGLNDAMLEWQTKEFLAREPRAPAPLFNNDEARVLEPDEAVARVRRKIVDRERMTDGQAFNERGLRCVQVLESGSDQVVQRRGAERFAEQLPDTVVFLQLVILDRTDHELPKEQHVAARTLMQSDGGAMGDPTAEYRVEQRLAVRNCQRLYFEHEG